MKIDATITKTAAKYVGIIALSLFLWFKDAVVGVFNTGISAGKKSEVKAIVNDPDVIRSIFANEETLKQVALIKKAGEDEMIKRETSRVGLRVLLGKDMDIREEKVSKEISWAYSFCKFMKLKMDSIIDYRVDKKVDPLIKNKVSLRKI